MTALTCDILNAQATLNQHRLTNRSRITFMSLHHRMLSRIAKKLALANLLGTRADQTYARGSPFLAAFEQLWDSETPRDDRVVCTPLTIYGDVF